MNEDVYVSVEVYCSESVVKKYLKDLGASWKEETFLNIFLGNTL